MARNSPAGGMRDERARLLMVSCAPATCELLLPLLGQQAEVHLVADGDSALARLPDAHGFVIGADGDQAAAALDLLRRIRALDPWIPTWLLAASAPLSQIVRAGRLGASGFMLTSEPAAEIAEQIGSLLKSHFLSATGAGALDREEPDPRWHFIGDSLVMRQLRAQCEQVAEVRSAVLITGEHGTGKEVVARHIHRCSPRAKKRFIAVNCAALPEGLVESELFGHERGAFTGAVKLHRGSFELADGGTLLLDEISEMPIGLQSKLLRALQSQEFVRLGGERVLRADTRVLCSTNRDPREAIQAGKLRADLFYRINTVTLQVPPLREHREDVPALARHFLRRISLQLGKPVEHISPAAESLLLSYDWPGNVRELENLIERAIVFCRSDEIGSELLGPIAEGAAYLALPWDTARELALRRFEVGYLSALLRIYRGSVSECAKAMQISRQALYKLLDRTGLDPASFRPSSRRS